MGYYGCTGRSLSLRLKMAQEPYIIWSLGPKASKYESLEPEGYIIVNYTFGDNITHYNTETVHFLGLMNSATK